MLSYVLIAFGVSLVTCLLMYIDSRLFDRPKKKLTYIKVMLMNMAIVLSVIYILTWLSPTSNLKDVIQSGGSGKPNMKIAGTDVVTIAEIGEEILAGPPQF